MKWIGVGFWGYILLPESSVECWNGSASSRFPGYESDGAWALDQLDEHCKPIDVFGATCLLLDGCDGELAILRASADAFYIIRLETYDGDEEDGPSTEDVMRAIRLARFRDLSISFHAKKEKYWLASVFDRVPYLDNAEVDSIFLNGGDFRISVATHSDECLSGNVYRFSKHAGSGS